jgi:hypothetical protein
MSWPSIDHSFLSPSGKISKRARKAYMDKFTKELFPDGLILKGQCKQPTKKEKLLRQAKMLRELADRGMSVKKYNKEADKLEKQANEL